MGKSLVIKKADFSTNGILAQHAEIGWIGLSATRLSFISSGITLKNRSRLVIDFSTKEFVPTENDRGGYIGAVANNGHVLALWFTAKYNTAVSPPILARGLQVVYGNTNSSRSHSLTLSSNIYDGNRHTVDVSPEGVNFDGTQYSWPDQTFVNNDRGLGTAFFYLDSANWITSLPNDDYFTTQPDMVRIHQVRIYDDTDEASLVFDGVPVRKTDGTICYYDRVSRNYFTRNDGSTPVSSEITE